MRGGVHPLYRIPYATLQERDSFRLWQIYQSTGRFPIVYRECEVKEVLRDPNHSFTSFYKTHQLLAETVSPVIDCREALYGGSLPLGSHHTQALVMLPSVRTHTQVVSSVSAP